MLNLHQLTIFSTVISEGSMTAAAEKLLLTQPAVSQQIRNLEEDLGIELLVRGLRQVKPTLQGEMLYDYAKKILQLVGQAEIAIKAMSAELKGELRVGTLNSIGLHLMSLIVGRLLRHNPEFRIKVDYGRGEDLIRAFQEKKFDILVLPKTEMEYGITLEDVQQKFLQREEMWFVGPGRDSQLPRQIKFSEINKHSIISFSGEYPRFSQKIESLSLEHGIDYKPVFESSNVGTLKRVIESGLGWGFLPSHSIRKQVRMGRLTRVHVEEMHYEFDLMYYYQSSIQSQALMEVFFQSIQQNQDKN